jgi:aspartate carbamoyltransferase
MASSRSKYDTPSLSNLLKASELSLESVSKLCMKAQEMKRLVATKGGDSRLQHRVLGSIFYEPSTRTSCSFTAAMMRLGGSVMPLNLETSSAKKGESLEDTIQTMACYCDALVLRHPSQGSAALAARYSKKPIINAGDGAGEHPTQALLDVFTIFSEMGRVGDFELREEPFSVSSEAKTGTPMRIVMLGDLKHGRTVHSLSRLLSLFGDIHIEYVTPHPSLGMPVEIIEELHAKGVPQTSGRTLEAAIGEADVLYVTRIQKERFKCEQDFEDACGSYCVDSSLMKKAKESMVVMHPLPRVNEISTDVDSDPRAAYFRQMENGMYMRMALLDCMIA